eukprot:452171_1
MKNHLKNININNNNNNNNNNKSIGLLTIKTKTKPKITSSISYCAHNIVEQDNHNTYLDGHNEICDSFGVPFNEQHVLSDLDEILTEMTNERNCTLQPFTDANVDNMCYFVTNTVSSKLTTDNPNSQTIQYPSATTSNTYNGFPNNSRTNGGNGKNHPIGNDNSDENRDDREDKNDDNDDNDGDDEDPNDNNNDMLNIVCHHPSCLALIAKKDEIIEEQYKLIKEKEKIIEIYFQTVTECQQRIALQQQQFSELQKLCPIDTNKKTSVKKCRKKQKNRKK